MAAMKSILTDVCVYMLSASENLTKAAESGDAELMEAVLINTRATIGTYIDALVSVKP